MYRVQLHRRAVTYFRKLPRNQQDRLKKALAGLANDPLHQPGIRGMVGEWAGYYRLRVGEVRVIFSVDEAAATVYVDHIGPRGDIYKR